MEPINSKDGLASIRMKADAIFVRISRDGHWGAISVKDMTSTELLDTLIMWIDQGRMMDTSDVFVSGPDIKTTNVRGK